MLHVDLPSPTEIERLAATRAEPCVSIYLPTTPITQDVGVDRIALKNLLREAMRLAEAAETPKRALWPIEEAVEHLIEDDAFWAHQANSLAVFATPDRIRTFRLPNRLEPMAEVADRFHLKPLLRARAFPNNAFVLAISEGATRLVEVSADLPAHEVRVEGMPRDARDALGRATLTNREPGHSGESSDHGRQLARYARAVDAALRPFLAGHDRPLIVAASQPMASIFQRVCSYPETAEEAIAGNPDRVSDADLAAAARPVIDRLNAARIAALHETFARRVGESRATTDIATAARAATFGAVDTLLVDFDAVVHGTVDADGGVVFADAPGAGSYGVIDEIADRAMASGAQVIAVRNPDVPEGAPLAAILRYPV